MERYHGKSLSYLFLSLSLSTVLLPLFLIFAPLHGNTLMPVSNMCRKPAVHANKNTLRH